MTTSSLPKIVFYDIDHTLTPSTRSWSPATIRTALALEHRRFPYTRQAISYPDIKQLLSSHGVPERETRSKTKYTLPAISLHYPDGKEEWIMDSVAIAPVLDSLVPASAEHPALFPESDKTRELLGELEKAFDAADNWQQIIPYVPAFLDKRGSDYFYETRDAVPTIAGLGGLEKMRRGVGLHGKDLVDDCKRALDAPAKLYAREASDNAQGPYLGGKRAPSYPDLVTCAMVEWWRCARGDAEIDEALKEVEGGILWPVVDQLAAILRRER